MTVRDVRQKWPEAERSLESEGEIIITRDGKPVARLLPMEQVDEKREQFDPAEQKRWREEFWGEGVIMDSLSGLLEDREDRDLISPSAGQSLAEWRKEFAADRVFDTTTSLQADRDS